MMKPGIYSDMPIEEYHSDKTILSSTGIKEAKKSSRHFAYYLSTDQERKTHFDFGNAFELALLDDVSGTNEFASNVAVFNTEGWTKEALKEKPGLRSPKSSKHYQDRKSEFLKENQGKYLIDDVGDESMDTIFNMVLSCKADKIISSVLGKMDYQKSFIWKDDETGVLCKTRPDLCVNKQKVIVDIKTCLDASPRAFFRDMAKFDYPLQATMQIEGVEQTGYVDKIDDYYWLCVEKTAPFNAQLYRFQLQDREMCHDAYRYYLTRAGKVINDFLTKRITDFTEIPGYTEMTADRFGIIDVEIPPYYLNN